MSGCYSISKSGDGWTISVDGATMLLCEFEKTAIKTVRRAKALSNAAAGGRTGNADARRRPLSNEERHERSAGSAPPH